MKRMLGIAIAFGMSLPELGAAVALNPRGTGQLLVYPYYTVNQQQTLLSIVNTTGHGKALKIRFREGYDGRDVASFNVYLGAYDEWVGAVFDTSGDGTGAAAIATNDLSCTVPAFDQTYFPGGPAVLRFSTKNYTSGGYGSPTGNDSGPTGPERTREGMFEVTEMGEIIDQVSGGHATLDAITPTGGNNYLGDYIPATPPDCGQVVNAWAQGGYWATDPTIDIAPPHGGVYGAAGIVNVAQGTLYAYDAYGVDGFSDVAQHTAPGDAKPNFSTAVTDSLAGIASAYVYIGDHLVKADYPAATRGVDAVSAIFMAEALFNEYNIEPGIGAASDWLIAFPTKEFYVDPGIVGATPTSYVAPFQATFASNGDTTPGADTGFSCVAVQLNFRDRQGRPPAPGIPCGSLCGIPVGDEVCYQVGALEIQNTSPGPSLALGSRLQQENVTPPSPSGHLILSFDVDEQQPNPASPALRPSSNGISFRGLPAVGFLAVNYVNGNVSPGVLSNYSGAYPHRSWVSCSPAPPCD